MRNRILIVAISVLALLVSAIPALAAVDTNAALDYLRTQQNADGGFSGGFSPDSAVGSTADAVLAIVAVGGDPASFDQGGNTPLTYLQANVPNATTSGDLAKLILALIAVGEQPRQFGGVDSVATLEGLVSASGKIGTEDDIFVSHLLAVLALKSAQRTIPATAIDYIKTAQQENGGWAWDGSSATAVDTNSTAFAVQALIAAGEEGSSEAVTNALSYLREMQNDDGGWPYQNPSDFGTDTDANSTAVTIQALIAAGQDPTGPDWTTASGNTPSVALEALQNPSGAFAWQAAVPDDNLLATFQALPAAGGKALPFASMDVGQPTATPLTMPVAGGPVLGAVLPMLIGGLALAGGGYALRRYGRR